MSNLNRKYTTADFSQLLRDAGSVNGPQMLKKATDEGTSTPSSMLLQVAIDSTSCLQVS